MFSKFSEEAQKCLILARDEMIKLNHPYVGSEHLLLAILSYENGVSRKLYKYDISYDRFSSELINVVGKGKIQSKWFLFTPLLKKVIQDAILDTKEKKGNQVTIEQLFLSLLEEGEGVAIRLLIGMNIDIDLLYKEFSSGLLVRKVQKEKNLIINDYSINFNKKVLANEIDPVVNRDKEVNKIIEILCRRSKNNPLLVGEAGVGKTAIVEELSRRIVDGSVPKQLQNKTILSISIAALVSGTKYRGEFEERINKIIKELENEDNIILFIDEVHTIVGAGGAEGAIDASNILKPSLARGKIRVIGATTNDEYIKYIERDKALDRRFQKVYIDEPSDSDTVHMLMSLKKIYEKFHNVVLDDDIVKYIVSMSNKYIHNRMNPDKSIDIMDEVCVKASILDENNITYFENYSKLKKITREKNLAVRNGDFVKASKLRKRENEIENVINSNGILLDKKKSLIITKNMVDRVIEEKTKIPIYKTRKESIDLLNRLNRRLKKNIIGQDKVLNDVLNTIKKILLGYRKDRPYSFLFIGPTGVGKTLFVKELALELYGKNNFFRIDMSEFKEESSISKLIGSSPGYVGYDDNNFILGKVRNHPYSVILLDEVEKASKSVIKLFLQILDEGIIHDSFGREIDFKNSIIFMTSNLGSNTNSIGFKEDNQFNQILTDFFSIEFLNRIDKICLFESINSDTVKKIVKLELDRVKIKYENIQLSFTDKKINELVKKTKCSLFGARRVQKVIEEEIENILINEILEGKTLVTL